ncbi:uncharacterized protein PGTG_11118 [Puccinia graminis f. sp. tritici CRL 75-36-700-3]|uniref:Uncharacterized protein n=1 Tax=Puccinia graminis f. sp. tritici (strain CRL 75-36-700-3 / race SCCL) TaxID=418459 RepID=E3KMU0_PUCGT|nr:uncharacterized protein PGTG_11118 [Puccinia graminis f. sp. tritici CRL 75-36-700-3]EFP85789.2 hypothetical protein PGTG_11118 [Puccinia graminis f. sp. tritici CRL 75-36-700-3]
MADSERSLIASVTRVLLGLSNKYERAADQAVYEWEDEEREPTEDDQNKKMEVFDKLHSSLLPSVNRHLSCLVTSLDLKYYPRSHPSPNLGSTLETLSSLERTLDQILVDFAVLKTPLPTVPHDHPQDRYKRFRSDELITNVSSLIQRSICSILFTGISFILLYEPSIDQPKTATFRTNTSQWAETVLQEITQSTGLVDKILRFSQTSDLEILQERWQETAETFDCMLADFAHLTHSALGEQRPLSAVRTDLLKQADSQITRIKLLRTLFDKVSNATTRRSMFRLDPEIDPESLCLIHRDSEGINSALLLAKYSLVQHFKDDEPNGDRAQRQNGISKTSRRIDSMLFLIGLYLVPQPSAIDHSSPAADFKAWLVMWQQLWHTEVAQL